MSGGGSSPDQHKTCGIYELLIFLAAIVTGTACSICSKTMMELPGIGQDGDVEIFEKPIFQTFGMFVGMMFGLIMHWIVLAFQINFPGYDFSKDDDNKKDVVAANPREQDPLLAINNNNNANGTVNNKNKTPVWMYFFLAIPAIFDLAATALCMMGLRYLDVSIYQLLRGSGIVFVALMKQYVLKDHLYTYQWVGVVYNVVSVFLVGGTAVLNELDDSVGGIDGDVTTKDPGLAFLGVLLVMCGAFVQALQFVFEEKVMTMDDAAVPPLLLIGMEGLWGTFLCLVVVYPMAYFIPGSDHGSYEDPWNTWHMFVNTPIIQTSFVLYFGAIFGYNLFAVLVTFSLNSIWHAILDNFRPITVWLTDLAIFYFITAGVYGEVLTKWSWVQLVGMFVLLYGTAIYNAPNTGSIRLEKQWYSLGFDFKHEYDQVEAQMAEQEMHAEWESKKAEFKKRNSSFAERSPRVSIYTQAHRGLGASHV